MRLIAAEYGGLEGPFTKVIAEFTGGVKRVLFFENDGRDMEVETLDGESDQDFYMKIVENDDMIYSDEALKLLDKVLKAGREDWEHKMGLDGVA